MSSDEVHAVLAGYASAADELISCFEKVSTAELFAAVRSHLPSTPVRVLDVGAGTGRDAAWFSRQGHHAFAVEPVDELRVAGQALHADEPIVWIDDCLPELGRVRPLQSFGLITLCGVWQHLDDRDREIAMGRLALLLGPDGIVIMSLRHGDGADSRTVYPVNVEQAIRSAERHKLRLLQRSQQGSIQAINRNARVSWTWLVLRRESPHDGRSSDNCGSERMHPPAWNTLPA